VVNGEAEVVALNQSGEIERSLYRAAPGEALTVSRPGTKRLS